MAVQTAADTRLVSVGTTAGTAKAHAEIAAGMAADSLADMAVAGTAAGTAEDFGEDTALGDTAMATVVVVHIQSCWQAEGRAG